MLIMEADRVPALTEKVKDIDQNAELYVYALGEPGDEQQWPISREQLQAKLDTQRSTSAFAREQLL